MKAILFDDSMLHELKEGDYMDIEHLVHGILEQVKEPPKLCAGGFTPFLVTNTDYAVLIEALTRFKETLIHYPKEDFKGAFFSKGFIETAINNLLKTFEVNNVDTTTA